MHIHHMYNSQFIHVYTAQPIGLGIAGEMAGGLKGRDLGADRPLSCQQFE